MKIWRNAKMSLRSHYRLTGGYTVMLRYAEIPHFVRNIVYPPTVAGNRTYEGMKLCMK